MKFENSAVPFKPRDVIVGSAIGGIVTLIIGPFGIFAGIISIMIAYFNKNNKVMFAGITMTLMGIAYYASTLFTEFMPSPMLFMNIPVTEKVVKAVSSNNGVANSFRVVNGVPTTLNIGDVWYNSNDTQFEGYDGENVVIIG